MSLAPVIALVRASAFDPGYPTDMTKRSLSSRSAGSFAPFALLTAGLLLLSGCGSDTGPSDGQPGPTTFGDTGGTTGSGGKAAGGAAGKSSGTAGTSAGGSGQGGSGQGGQAAGGEAAGGQAAGGEAAGGQAQGGQAAGGEAQGGQAQAGQAQGGQAAGGEAAGGQAAGGEAAGGQAQGGQATGGSAGQAAGGEAAGGQAQGGQAAGGSAQGGSAQGGSAQGGGAQGGSAQGGAGGGDAIPAIPAAARDAIGLECTSSLDCNGGLCLTASGAELNGAGPANGYCSADCTKYLELVNANPDQAYVDPCDPDAGSKPIPSALCLNFSDTGVTGRCMQTCSWGNPTADQVGNGLSPDKCHGRLDQTCFPITDPGTGVELISWCRPQCTSNDDCPAGRQCDFSTGTCVDNLQAGLKPGGQACSVADNAPRECAGICVRLYGSTAPVAKQDNGICFDLCVSNIFDGAPGCGGLTDLSASNDLLGGYCGLFNLFGPDGDGDPGTFDAITAGPGDIAVCSYGDSYGDDSNCLTAEGWFTRSLFAGNQGGNDLFLTTCLPATECATDNDCAYDCNLPSECGDEPGVQCISNKCSLNGQPYSGKRPSTCTLVNEVCGKSFCLDHAPTNIPVVPANECQ